MWKQLVDQTQEGCLFVDDQTLEFNFKHLKSFVCCLQDLEHISDEHYNEMTSKLNQVSDCDYVRLLSACEHQA